MVDVKEVARRIAKIDFKVRVVVYEGEDDNPVCRDSLEAWPSIFVGARNVPSAYLKRMVKDASRVEVIKLQALK